MEFLISNWFLPVALLAVIAAGGYTAYVFLKRPTSEQINSVLEWLLYAVTVAEKELGSGTGQLKLRYVYNMFLDRFRWLSRVITFSMFSELVDDALAQMRKLLSTNNAVQNYVIGLDAKEES